VNTMYSLGCHRFAIEDLHAIDDWQYISFSLVTRIESTHRNHSHSSTTLGSSAESHHLGWRSLRQVLQEEELTGRSAPSRHSGLGLHE
jgi:hypothetical protein